MENEQELEKLQALGFRIRNQIDVLDNQYKQVIGRVMELSKDVEKEQKKVVKEVEPKLKK